MLQFTFLRSSRELLAILATCFVLSSGVSAAPLPAELMAKKPEFFSVQISPKGKSVAYMRVNDDDLMSLEVLDLATGKKQGVAGTENYDVGGFFWIDEEHLAVVLSEDKLYGVGVYVYDRKTARLGAIAERGRGAGGLVGVPLNRSNRVIAATTGENGVLVELATNVDMKNSRFGSNTDPVRRSYAPPDGRVMGYETDVVGEPVLSTVYEEGAYRGHILNARDETWRKLPLDLRETPIMAIAADQQLAWVVKSTADGGTALHRYDLIDATFGPEVYSDPDYDIGTGGLILNRDGTELQGISYNRVRRHTVWFDEDLETAHSKLTAALQGYDVYLSSRSRDQQRVIFVARSSTEPGQYFLADLATGQIQHLAAASPWLEGQPLSPTASFNFTARDGLTMQAYLTLPTGEGAQKPYPLMVLGHGGPWARDTWTFNGEVQFFASRGFAVMQPNYRGSTGFSRAISIDDRYDYRKMHEDVTDAVQTLIKSGHVDPDRIAIMGASFGGFLAVAGAAWEPDLYRVAISNVGVFDWEMRISDSGRGSLIVKDLLKSFWSDDPMRARRYSPIHQADQIKIPVFLAHGRQDSNVDISQSVRLERILSSRGIPHETYYEADSGHGFASAEAQAAYLEKVDEFLQKYFWTGTPRVEAGEAKVTEMPAR